MLHTNYNMDLQSTLNKLYSLHQFGIKLGLDNITNFLIRLGNPQNKYQSFHVAGSNGKGSTISFIASILMEKGYKTGLYTSPHFVKFNERVRIDKTQITDEYICDFVNGNYKYIEEKSLTFFEVTTAMAFKYFEDCKIEYAAIETGLGGRLDATNVITPIASMITSISEEHTEILGNTIEEIAFEKAGIIKPGSQVFVGIMPREAEEVISKSAETNKSKIHFIKDFLEEKEDSLKLKLLTKNYNIYATPLHGRHQLLNASLAVKTYSTVMKDEENSAILNGISNVVKNTGIQGRYEVFKEKPRIIFDSAHNPEGVRVFVNEFKKIFRKHSRRILIFTALRDKAAFEMLTILSPYFTDFYVTAVKNERALTIEELLKLCKTLGLRAKPLSDPEVFIRNFEKEENDNCMAILGSMYLLGELKEKISKNA